MNKRLTKVFSFAVIGLLALGEGTQLVNAVTEEATSSTPANEEVLPAQETVDSSGKATASSTEEATEEATSSSEAATTEATTETSEEKENKKEKSKATRGATDPVNIPDPTLYQLIRYALNSSPHNLGLTDGATINEGQMELLTKLNRGSSMSPTSNSSITSLDGIQYATNLEDLNLSSGTADTYTSLPLGFSDLKKLTSFSFSSGALNDIDELKNHPTLQSFYAKDSRLTSLEGLSGCTKLEVINVDGSGAIQNFKGLEQSTKLKEISFGRSTSGDPRVAAGDSKPSYVGYGLQSLEGLNCGTALETLSLSGHPGLENLTGLENYTQLKVLKVAGDRDYNGRDQYYQNPGGLDVGDLEFDPNIHTPTFRTRGLQGSNAIDALSGCTALTEVTLNNNAIENLGSLAGKSALKSLNVSNNLIETLAPLSTTNKIEILSAQNNLLANLSGLENTDTLKDVNVSSQAGGGVQMSNGASTEYYLNGLLSDISALNSTSLVTFSSNNNRLTSLSSLKNASNLVTLNSTNNLFDDISGDLDGCGSLETVWLTHNKFVNFKDMGLQDAKNSLKKIYIGGQGTISIASGGGGSSNNDGTLLVSLDGLKAFSVLHTINMNVNKITDSEMVHIPDSIVRIDVEQNELQDQAFSSFDPSEKTKLYEIYGMANHISDITPLEAFSGTALTRVFLSSQTIVVPKHGGTVTKKATPGFEVDVLKADHGVGLTFTRGTGWTGIGTATVKVGTNILDIDDPNYDLEGRNPTTDFKYTSNSAIGMVFDGRITIAADHGIATEAELTLVPTDVDGNEITEISQGGVIYWRSEVKGKDAQYLMKPDFKYHLQFKPHTILDPYVDPLDSKASEYVKGARVEINGTVIAPSTGIWSQVDVLDNMINKDDVAKITIVTKVNDDATPGEVARLYFNVEGKNFKLVGERKDVTIKKSGPEVLELDAADRFDFGKGNEATKTAKTYKPDAKSYTAQEQTDGFNVRVTDSRQTSKRTDWKVVGQLSDLTNSKSAALKAGSVAPTLALKDISLYKMDLATSTETAISHGATGNPTWDQNILLTAGGSSVTLSTAVSANGEGVWDYRIPFDKVELNVPSNVSEQAGYTFNGKLTWTLEDTL